MSAREQSTETTYAWIIIFASLVIHSIGMGAPNILFVTLKDIAADFDAPRAMPSMAYSLMMLGAGVGGIGMGWWMDRRGIMQPVLFGAIMIGLGSLLASQAESRFGLYVANGLLIGLFGKAAMIAPLIANATRWFDRRRGLAVAIIASGQGVAGAIWPPVIRILDDSIGWRDTYFYFGIFALVTMVPLTFLLRPRPPAATGAHARHHVDARGHVLGLPSFAVQGMLWAAVVGCCTAMAMPIVHLISHATDLGYSSARGAELLSVLFIASFVSRIGFGLLSDRIGPMPTLLFGSASQATMLLAFALVDSLAGLYLCALLFGLGFAGIMPCYALVIRILFPESQLGWRIASQYLFGALGMALGGWLGGAVHDLTGSYADAFLAGFAFNLMNLALVAALFTRRDRMKLEPRPA